MPWKGVTVTEQRQRFLEDYQLNETPISELAERFSISLKTVYKWTASSGMVTRAFMSFTSGHETVPGRPTRGSSRKGWMS